MVSNYTLKARLRPHLKPLKLTQEQEEQLTRELNYLSALIIDGYLKKKQNGKHQATTS